MGKKIIGFVGLMTIICGVTQIPAGIEYLNALSQTPDNDKTEITNDLHKDCDDFKRLGFPEGWTGTTVYLKRGDVVQISRSFGIAENDRRVRVLVSGKARAEAEVDPYAVNAYRIADAAGSEFRLSFNPDLTDWPKDVGVGLNCAAKISSATEKLFWKRARVEGK